MGVRAVLVIEDESGQRRRFWASWASKQYQIPHLARFLHAADRDGAPLSVDTYLDYVAVYPGTLPGDDVTGRGGYTDPREVGDLDYRYELALRESDRTFRYLVHERDRGPDARVWRRSEELATRARLYAAAARMCQELAANTQRYADRNGGVVPAPWPSAPEWRGEATTFTQWADHAATQPDDVPGPSIDPVSERYAVGAARARSRRISARLREDYPDAAIRTRVSADGVITLTVPVALATDTESARIAAVIGGLFDHTFTLDVRPARHGARGVASPQPAATTMLTLRPQP